MLRRRLRHSRTSSPRRANTPVATGFAGGLWNAGHVSTSASDTPRVTALAPECTSANHLSLTSFHQGTAMQNVFHVIFTNHSAAACSLRGVPALQFVDGPHHIPEGPMRSHVSDDQGVTTIELRAHGSSGAMVWAVLPIGLQSRLCGHLLPENGFTLTYAPHASLYVQTFPSTARGGWSTTGTCSRRSTFSSYDPDPYSLPISRTN